MLVQDASFGKKNINEILIPFYNKRAIVTVSQSSPWLSQSSLHPCHMQGVSVLPDTTHVILNAIL